jgi:dienelactone hydrolase
VDPDVFAAFVDALVEQYLSSSHPILRSLVEGFLAEDAMLSGVRDVVLFHSVYGLRPAVLAAAEMLRAAGHRVVTPDLYGGPVASSIEEGFAISERVGWAAIMRRARDAVQDVPATAVLAGISMGAGVAGELLAERPGASGLLVLNGIGGRPRAGLPVQAHVGEADTMFPPAELAAWERGMTAGGAVVEVFSYPGARHFFTDSGASEYDEVAAGLAWRRGRDFLTRTDAPITG